MKEASGELSMTAVAVVAIAAIGVVFTTLIWPGIRATINRNTWCSQATRCDDPTGGTQQCWYIDREGSEQGPITCPAQDRSGGDNEPN